MKRTLLYILMFVCCGVAKASPNYSAIRESADSTSRYMRLFTPLRHYDDAAEKYFTMNENTDTLVSGILLRTYLRHPEMVARRTATRKYGSEVIVKKNTEAQKPKEPEVPFVSPDIDTDFSPVELVVTKPNFWTISGDCYLQMMQNMYSANWYQGGESNYSGIARVTLNFNYNNKQKIKFENKFEMNLGLQTFSDDSVHSARTTSDFLRLTNRFELRAAKSWYYAIQNVASTQLLKSYASNSTVVNSAFMSPFTDNISIGMDYNINWVHGTLTGTAHFAPFAVNVTHVSRAELAEANGIDAGKHDKWQWGPNINIDSDWKINDVFEWKSRFYLFTTFHQFDFQWENTIDIKLTRFIAASIYIYPKFDDSVIRHDKWGYWQLKEFTSLGLTYSF